MAVAHRARHRFDQVGRGDESELNWIPDIEIADLPAGPLHLLRLDDNIPDGVAEPIDAPSGSNWSGGGGHAVHLTGVSHRPQLAAPAHPTV